MTQSIAIIGASADPAKFGNKAVRAYLQSGWRVFPIHPTAKLIEGQPTFAKITEIPTLALNRVSLYLPTSLALAVLPQIAKLRIEEVWLNPGADSEEVVTAATALGLPIVRGCSIEDIGASPNDL